MLHVLLFVLVGFCCAVSSAEITEKKKETMREDGEFIPVTKSTDSDLGDGQWDTTEAERSLQAMVGAWRQKAGVMLSASAVSAAGDIMQPDHSGVLSTTPGHPGFSATREGARGPCVTGDGRTFLVWSLRKGCPCGGGHQDPVGSAARRGAAAQQTLLDGIYAGNTAHLPAPMEHDNCNTHACKPQASCSIEPLNGYDPCRNVAEGAACTLCQASDTDCTEYNHDYGTSSKCTRRWGRAPTNSYGGRPSNYHAAQPDALTCLMERNPTTGALIVSGATADASKAHDPCMTTDGAWQPHNTPCTFCKPGDTSCTEPNPTHLKTCQLHGWNGAMACKKVACDMCTSTITLDLGFPNRFDFTRHQDFPSPSYLARFSDPAAQNAARQWQILKEANASAVNLAIKSWLDSTEGLHLAGTCGLSPGVNASLYSCSVANPTVKDSCEQGANCTWTSAMNIGACTYQSRECGHCSAQSVFAAHLRDNNEAPTTSTVYCGWEAPAWKKLTTVQSYDGAGANQMLGTYTYTNAAPSAAFS